MGADGLSERRLPAIAVGPSLHGAEWPPNTTQDNLYLAAHFISFAPMSNKQAEATQQGFGGGDALQLRLSDGKKIFLCGWYDTAAKRPALTCDPNNLPNPFLLRQGAREAFRADADGRGYTQEIALPWKLLFGRAAQGGPAAPGHLPGVVGRPHAPLLAARQGHARADGGPRRRLSHAGRRPTHARACSTAKAACSAGSCRTSFASPANAANRGTGSISGAARCPRATIG